jgi:hypothetical protein
MTINRMNLGRALCTMALATASLAQAAPMSRPDYQAGKARLDATYKMDKAACDALAANAKDICMEQAKGRDRVAQAELEYGYTGKAADQNRIAVVRAESDYAVAREKCDDLAGNAKDVCIKEAKAGEVRALSDAKIEKKVGVMIDDAARDTMDADYKVAAEKCDALSGADKSACMVAAKAQFGKR